MFFYGKKIRKKNVSNYKEKFHGLYYIHKSLRNIFVKVKKFILFLFFSADINFECSVYFLMLKYSRFVFQLGKFFFLQNLYIFDSNANLCHKGFTFILVYLFLFKVFKFLVTKVFIASN